MSRRFFADVIANFPTSQNIGDVAVYGTMTSAVDHYQSHPASALTRATTYLACFLCIPYAVVGFALLVGGVAELIFKYFLTGRAISPNEVHAFQIERSCRRSLLLLSIWLMNVIVTILHGIHGLLIPSLVIESSNAHASYVAKGDLLRKDIDDEIINCERLLDRSREQRRRHLQELASSSLDDVLKAYQTSIAESKDLKEHLQALKSDRCHAELLYNTQAMADRTGYRGLADWSKAALNEHEHLLTATAQLSFLGAGLTYGTIFSATRGNLGLMCYAFALFNFGFMVPLACHALLKWASRRSPKSKFASPHILRMILSFLIYCSVSTAVAAICLLNVTIIQLRFQVDNSGVKQDSSLQLSVFPSPAGYIVIGCAGFIAIGTFFALLFHYIANGWCNLPLAVIGYASRTPGEGVDNCIWV